MTYLRKTPRQHRAEATLEAIVEAAAHILRESGAEALTTNAIAARAGASIGSLYQYFPNKQSIVHALMEREFQRAEAIRPALIDADAPTSVVVRAVVDWHCEIRGRDPELWRNLRTFVREVLPDEELAKVAALRRARVTRTVRRLLGPHSDRPVDDVTFIVDVALNAVLDETLRRDPARLSSEMFRAEVAALLLGYLSTRKTV